MVIYGADSPFQYHTKLAQLFPPLHGYHISLTWMISDFEGYPTPESFSSTSPFLISGKELEQVITTNPEMQIIWGVLSGFRIPAEQIDMSVVPIAEEASLWEANYTIQHPQAECEVAAWDSSATFFRSKNLKAMRRFSRAFPTAITLSKFNPDQS